MNHIFLLVICVLSVEIFIKSHYIDLISSLIKLSKKSTKIILCKNISDHWKETIIPKYSMKMMKYSLQMLLILCLIIFIFLISEKFYSGFLDFVVSWNGIIESLLFAFSYIYIKKLFI